ncbi:MAG: AI-2E family transporter, partial [Oscillospiraceae bacterium]|nr:AI-2E family transporter [Oscillospiraceae bacterium]
MSAKQRPLLRNAVLTAASVVGVFVLLPLALPFVLAYLISWWVEPAVAALGRRTHLPRWLRSGLCITALFAAMGAILFLLGRVIWEELARLVREHDAGVARDRPEQIEHDHVEVAEALVEEAGVVAQVPEAAGVVVGVAVA